MIHYECPACGERMQSPESVQGEQETCPRCGAGVQVPDVAKGVPVRLRGEGALARLLAMSRRVRRSAPLLRDVFVLGILAVVFLQTIRVHSRLVELEQEVRVVRWGAIGGIPRARSLHARLDNIEDDLRTVALDVSSIEFLMNMPR